MVTVTRQLPAFTPFTAVPSTLQYFALADATFTVTFDPDRTDTPALFRIDVPVSVLPVLTDGAVAVPVVFVAVAVATVDGAVVATELSGEVPCVAIVVPGSELDGATELLDDELLDELDDDAAALVLVAAALVTATE